MTTDIATQIKIATPLNVALPSIPKTSSSPEAAPVAASQLTQERQNSAVAGQVGAPVVTAKQTGTVSQAGITEAVTYYNKQMQKFQTNLEFSVEEETGMVLVKVYDAETEELVRQIPSEQVVKMARFMHEQSGVDAGRIEGLLLEEQA
ncbi:MAG: flagellar protein FlaG [Halothiobacillaceae bacterium]|nr:MAG: flagellar protein FlaG [Halothiobacillaceae bacterium]